MEKGKHLQLAKKAIEVAETLCGLSKSEMYQEEEVVLGCMTYLVDVAIKEDGLYGDMSAKEVLIQGIETLYSEANKKIEEHK